MFALIHDKQVIQVSSVQFPVAKPLHWKECASDVATGWRYDLASGNMYPPKAPQLTQRDINEAARGYLSSTDWYVIRQQETGTPIPEDILVARADARTKVV